MYYTCALLYVYIFADCSGGKGERGVCVLSFVACRRIQTAENHSGGFGFIAGTCEVKVFSVGRLRLRAFAAPAFPSIT